MSYIDPQHKILFHAERLAELARAGRTSVPVNVEIDLSNRCSHGCVFCHFAYTHTRGPLADKGPKPTDRIPGGDLMPLVLAQRIIDQLADAGVKSITWTGGGEPTLHPDFEAIVRYAQAAGLEQGLYTHGGHITHERAALLKRACTWVYVSLDCADRESFKQVKGVDRFDAVMEGVHRLVTAEGGATVGLGFLLTGYNLDDIDRMVALGRTLGVGYVQFRPAIRYDAHEPSQRAESATWIGDALNRITRYSGDPFVIVDFDRFRMYRDWQGHGYNVCRWVAIQTVVTPNGMMWRCCNRREHADSLLGDLSRETFAEVWARVEPVPVDAQCRVMCRGHMANLTLDALATQPAHANFV